MTAPKKTQHRPSLQTEMHELHESVVASNVLYRRITRVRRTLAISFLSGVASTVGAIVTVVIVIPVAVWFMQSINWPPIIAGIVTNIILLTEQANPR